MTLPSFLVIGAQRAGTTLLHERLDGHPQVFMPRARKELHYFDREQARGIEWYEGFFPGSDEAEEFRAIGEVTPCYLFHPEVPKRIEATLGTIPLIAVLRDPVERAYSQYGLWVRDNALTLSFDEFLLQNDNVFERGLYADQLSRYLDLWPRDRVMILIFERMRADLDRTFELIANFLDIDPDPFADLGVVPPSNASYRPRYPWLRSVAQSLGRSLRRRGVDWPVNLARNTGAARWFGNSGPLPPMSESTRCRLYDRYSESVARTERLLEIELPEWRQF